MPGGRQPTAPTIQTVLITLRDRGAVVLPKEWDGEYVLGEINRRLHSKYFETARLIEHTSFALEGIVGAKVRAIVLEKVQSRQGDTRREV